MKKKSQSQYQMMICIIDEVFRAAYARQGMSYEPIENDAYEHDELI